MPSEALAEDTTYTASTMADDFSGSDKQPKQAATNQNKKQYLKMLYRDNPNYSHIIDTALKAAEAVMDPNLPKIGFSFRKLSSRYTRIDILADRAFEGGDLELSRRKYNESLQLKHRALLLCSTTEDRNRTLAEMATTINNLAYMKQRKSKGSRDSILSAYETVLLIKQYVDGPRHITVGTTLNNIGSVHFMEGNRLEAIIAYRKARKILREHFGLEHLDICVVSSNIGDVFYQLGQWRQASAEYRAALRLRWIILGNKDPKVVRLMERLAETEMRTLNSENEAGEVTVEVDDDCLSDDGSFVGAVDRLQCEIDQDLEFFDSLEQQAPVQMIRDKTSVFKELRQLNCDSDEESDRIDDICVEEETATVASELDKEPHPEAESSASDEISNSTANQRNLAFNCSTSSSSPWVPPQSISREFDLLSACIMDMENLAASDHDALEQDDSDSSCGGSLTEHGRLMLSALLSDDEADGSTTTSQASLDGDSKVDDESAILLSDKDDVDESQSSNAQAPKSQQQSPAMDPIILLSALCSSSLVLQNSASAAQTTEPPEETHSDLEESSEALKDSQDTQAVELPPSTRSDSEDESTSLPEASSDQISLGPGEVSGSIKLPTQEKDLSAADADTCQEPPTHQSSSYRPLIFLSAVCSSASLLRNSAAASVDQKYDATEEPPIVSLSSNADGQVASRTTLEHSPSLSEASTGSDSNSPQPEKPETFDVGTVSSDKTSMSSMPSDSNDDSTASSVASGWVESNPTEEFTTHDEGKASDLEGADVRGAPACTIGGLKPLSAYLNLTRSRKKSSALTPLDPDQRREALVELRERLGQVRQRRGLYEM